MPIYDERDAGNGGDPRVRDQVPRRDEPRWRDDPPPRGPDPRRPDDASRRDDEWDGSPYDGERPYDGYRRETDRPPRDEADRSILADLMDQFSDALSTLLGVVPLGPSKVKRLTYRAAVAWFVEKRPPVVNRVQGALFRKPHGKDWLVFQTFVDEQGEVVSDRRGRPWGRKLIVLAMDEELESLFGGHDLVLFK